MMTTNAKTTNAKLLDFVKQAEALCQPDQVYWCDGSQEEYDRPCQEMGAGGAVIRRAAV